MRLDHLLSRDLGACGGAGARTGASPGSSRGLSGGRTGGRTGTRSPLTLVLLGAWGVPAFFLLLPACVRGVWWGGGGACCRGLGLRALLCPASASLLVVCCCLFGGGVGGCGGVGGLVVNCIVDASIFVLCGVFLLCASRLGPAALSWCGGFWAWVCLCCVLFLWAFGGCLGTRGR